MEIAIINYGVGNLQSISNAFSACGQKIHITSDANTIREADALVLPGVGAFSDGMAQLAAGSLSKVIIEFAAKGKPLLGICLGMQMLLDSSEEFGLHQGLGIIPGTVRALRHLKGFDQKAKTPHIGWTSWRSHAASPLFDGLEGQEVYFIHSFCAVPEHDENIAATAEYGDLRFAAAIQKDMVFGCQFHPEKSGPHGLRIIKNFINIVNNTLL